MRLSRKWLHEEYIDLSHISDQELIDRMTAFGHHVKAISANNDTILEFATLEHRPDCDSIIGLVREIAAAFQIPYRQNEAEVNGTEECSIYEMLDADVWAEHLCNRFSCIVAVNVHIFPSPDWMQQRLLSCGIAPVNCIVDAANYTSLEYGQTITVMDYASVTSGSIWIREAMPGEVSSSVCELPVLSDSMDPLAYGDNLISPESQITENTTTVIAIAADYNASSSNPMLTLPALQRFCQLVEQLQIGKIADGIIDLLSYVPQPRTLPFDFQAINRELKLELSSQTMTEYLESVGIDCSEQEILLPSHRNDLASLEDIAAEIRRIHTIVI